MLYFAYGSNLDWAQMKNRCPSARFVAVAALPDYRLGFTRRSVTRGCGAADAVAEVGGNVWGVVYEVSDFDLGQLDTSEGYRPGREVNSYWRRECMVSLGMDDRHPLNLSTYFADPQPNPPLPNQTYKGLILAVARHSHLPTDYVASLEQIKVAG